ncbi:hypothetical protein BDV36DRAFT_293679 [Aspergillus pseudocaelatus]|uniref:Uncharacterized protein n=1 Tax=Aspergillus pseudocaelatus TaxID=1825620 RepID=A0ABQ6WSD8_9EURO|nr:hypothetical protein BDV36DRAFT_293679 [Aspergillus pseudocaelatus]
MLLATTSSGAANLSPLAPPTMPFKTQLFTLPERILHFSKMSINIAGVSVYLCGIHILTLKQLIVKMRRSILETLMDQATGNEINDWVRRAGNGFSKSTARKEAMAR